MYTTRNFKTKKALKEAVAQRNAFNEMVTRVGDEEARTRSKEYLGFVPQKVEYYQPNGDLTGVNPPLDGTITLEGPHYPEPHRWYATAVVKNGEVIKVS
jgi:hypothetical protein